MITEDFISFEIAKLLEEKGFDAAVLYVYIDIEKSDKKPYLRDTLCNYNDGHIKDLISAPTIQMAMKWLREEHNLFIELQCYGVDCDENAHFEYSYVIREYTEYNNEICKTVGLIQKHGKSRFNLYEEACEAAIKYCLENLI